MTSMRKMVDVPGLLITFAPSFTIHRVNKTLNYPLPPPRPNLALVFINYYQSINPDETSEIKQFGTELMYSTNNVFFEVEEHQTRSCQTCTEGLEKTVRSSELRK